MLRASQSKAASAFVLACLLAGACVAGETAGEGGGGADGPGAGAGPGATTGAQGGGFGATTGTGGSGGGEPEIAEVYGHSAATLYRLDPITKAVTTVGNFAGCSSVIDIALDKDSKLIGTTFDGIYTIDKATAQCSLITSGSYPNSLSFIPEGTLDPNVEALVGYEGDQYVRIDPTTGSKQLIGSLGDGGLVSSGDVVSVKGGKSFLTVTGFDCPTDCLIEINPVTGAMVNNWGPLGYSAVYGIAFWAGSVYGFSEAGQLFEVSFPNQVLMTTLITQPPGTQFWGAGSTTSAPPDPVPE
ncbi:MAG: hypothetical protein HOV80_08915 [Polyangiaceae bacterium]|nr:hypothetical protein [Polyangiaceae bacterium]